MYSVRDPNVDDMEEMVNITERVWNESFYAPLAFSHEKTLNYIYGAVVKQPNWFARIIVDENNKPVGGLIGYCESMLSSNDLIAYDVSMLIDKDHRGRCLKEFVQVIEEFKQWSIKSGAKVIKVGVSSGINIDKASAFIERLGFARIGALHGMTVGE